VPAKTQLASRLRSVINSAGLMPIAFVVWRTLREWSPALVLRNRRHRRDNQKITPVPPSNLIFSATGTRDVDWFLTSGRASAEVLRKALVSIGRPLESFERVFELGCGCGRVLRQWIDVDGPEFFASDYNPLAVAWGRENLAHVSIGLNKLEPPLPYETAAFDLCYAISVFTHLPEPLQKPWLAELRRVLRPGGGILIVTLSGQGDLVRVPRSEQKKFENGELVIISPEYAGTNLCGVYHPESFVRKEWSSEFRVLQFLPQGALGSPQQDLYVLERVD
jgi:SAM-dependent methyltransferase